MKGKKKISDFLIDNKVPLTDKKNIWFSVREVFRWGEDPEIDEYYDKLLEKFSKPMVLRKVNYLKYPVFK